MVIPSPMPLAQEDQPFDDPNWLYEFKHDGFRALAVIKRGACRFISRNKHKLDGLRDLGEELIKQGTRSRPSWTGSWWSSGAPDRT